MLYEPSIALFTDHNLSYKRIAEDISKVLNNNGNIYIEIGYHNKNDVINIFEYYGFKCKEQFNDLNGCVRVLKF